MATPKTLQPEILVKTLTANVKLSAEKRKGAGLTCQNGKILHFFLQ